jgi:predicted acyltransferase
MEYSDNPIRQHQRYLAIDVLRGLTVALMVVVNNPGTWESIYSPLEHALWHGFTPTDMVFPSFLFVVGNAMSFSMRKFGGQPHHVLLKKILVRTLLIFLIGLFLNAYPFVRLGESGLEARDLTAVRIFGVLQRIALCYGMAALIVLYMSGKSAMWAGAAILIGYWALMSYFGSGTDPYGLEGNAVRELDLWIIGPVNLYKGEGIPFDPEGILSTLPAVVNVLGGYFAGQFIQQYGHSRHSITKLITAGALLVAIGLAWHLLFPINKKIWTSSYVVLTVGLSTLLLAALVFIIEVKRSTRWVYFFEVFGRNPLVLFAMSGIIVKTMALFSVSELPLKLWIFKTFFVPLNNIKLASLAYAISFMLLIWLIGFFMDRRKIYIKV